MGALASFCNEVEVQIGDMLKPRAIGVKPVSLKFVSQDQITGQGEAAHNVRRIRWGEGGYIPGIVLWKEHIVNSCKRHGMANGETCVRFENDIRDKKWRAKYGRRHY